VIICVDVEEADVEEGSALTAKIPAAATVQSEKWCTPTSGRM
jgi:hypothetical protein